MNTAEWAAVAARLVAWWPASKLSNETLALWLEDFRDHDQADVVAALRIIRLEGSDFAPSVGHVLSTMRHDPSTPTFDELLIVIFGRRGILNAQPAPRGLWIGDERRVAREQARRAKTQQIHPTAAQFIYRMTFARLERVDLEDEWARKELREAWAAHLDATDGREVHAIARSNNTRAGLRQVDPLAALTIEQQRTPGTA